MAHLTELLSLRYGDLRHAAAPLKLAQSPRTNVLMAVMLAVTLPMLAGMVLAPSEAGIIGFTALAVVAVCIAACVLTRAADAQAFWDRRVREYIDSLELASRRPRSHREGRGRPGSDRQANHEWYGQESSLNWRDRIQAQSWGMSADEYRNNVLEDDKG